MTSTERKIAKDLRRLNGQYGGYQNGTLSDYLTVYRCFCSGDYSAAFQTKLYTQHGGEYCTLLEVLNWYYKDQKAR